MWDGMLLSCTEVREKGSGLIDENDAMLLSCREGQREGKAYLIDWLIDEMKGPVERTEKTGKAVWLVDWLID